MRQKHRSLIFELIALSVLPLFLFGSIVLIFGVFTFSSALENEAKDGLGGLAHSLNKTYEMAYAGDYSLSGDVLKKGVHVISGDMSIIDYMKQSSGVDATIFYGDTRMVTTIEGDAGRAVGTKAAQEVIKKVLEEGQDFFSKNVSVNGTPYFGYYVPLCNQDGSVIGMAFVGKPSTAVMQFIMNTVIKLAVIAAIGLAVTVLLCIFYAKKILYILRKIMSFLADIAHGNIRETLEPSLLGRRDEIGKIAKSAASLQGAIVELTGTDPLTNLYNRRSGGVTLENLFRDCQKSGKTFSVAMGDIDDFKNINDRYGHPGGDVVLKTLARLFQSHMENKGFVFRWGGEEFLFVYENAEKETAFACLKQLRKEIGAAKIQYKDQTIPVTMTFGVAQHQSCQDLDSLVRCADDRLYWGKSHNKDQIVGDGNLG